jgi:predicted site-specific integrase-resolvase
MNIQLLNLFGVARQLSTTHDQAKRLVDTGALPVVVLPNGQERVDQQDVRAWITRSKRRTTPLPTTVRPAVRISDR